MTIFAPTKDQIINATQTRASADRELFGVNKNLTYSFGIFRPVLFVYQIFWIRILFQLVRDARGKFGGIGGGIFIRYSGGVYVVGIDVGKNSPVFGGGDAQGERSIVVVHFLFL